MEGGDGDGKTAFNIHLNSALSHIKLGKACEQEDKHEAAYKHYVEASNKLMELLRKEADEERKASFMKHLQICLTNAGFQKQIIADKKTAIIKQQGQLVQPSKQPLGLACLGGQHMFAHDFYKSMGDRYFSLATQHG